MFIDDDTLVMTPAERAASSILVVEADPNHRNNMRNALKTLGYGVISDAPNHTTALERMKERRFTHVLFDAKKSNMEPKDFLRVVLEGDSATVAIPTSGQPSIDDVFDLFVMGAKGFVVKPFTIDSVEEAIVMASKGEPIAEAVLKAKNRNEALVAVMMTSLDKVSTLLRQGQQFETALREVPRAMRTFMRASDLAKTFCKGGDEALLEALQNFCIDRGKGPATRLGRLRKRLKNTRVTDEKDGEEEESADSAGA